MAIAREDLRLHVAICHQPREHGFVTLVELRLSRHAIQRMFERSISVSEVRQLVEHGVTIETYPDDQPWPSRLILAMVEQRPLHAVVAETESRICYVITVYEPDPARWGDGFRTRRTE